MYLFQLYFSQGICPVLGLLSHMVVLFLAFKGISIPSSIVAVSIYISTNSERDTGDTGLIPGSRRSPGGGHGNPLQYSCLENPVDRGPWLATVHGVTESDKTETTEHTHNRILLSHKMKCIWVSSDEVDESSTSYTEWRESERER